MNLTNEIIKHVFYCLGIKTSGNNNDKVKQVTQPQFLLNTKLNFEDGTSNDVWGLQMITDNDSKVKILIADCGSGVDSEWAILIDVDGAPNYACYYDYGTNNGLIACNINNSAWAECSVYLQATFLAGMEKLREFGSNFSKIDSEDSCENLFRFIDFYQEKEIFE